MSSQSTTCVGERGEQSNEVLMHVDVDGDAAYDPPDDEDQFIYLPLSSLILSF